MVHYDVYKYFKKLMPFYDKDVKEWFPCGFNCIRIRLNDDKEYIFTIYSDDSWRFETLSLYIDRMKGAKQVKC